MYIDVPSSKSTLTMITKSLDPILMNWSDSPMLLKFFVLMKSEMKDGEKFSCSAHIDDVLIHSLHFLSDRINLFMSITISWRVIKILIKDNHITAPVWYENPAVFSHFLHNSNQCSSAQPEVLLRMHQAEGNWVLLCTAATSWKERCSS